MEIDKVEYSTTSSANYRLYRPRKHLKVCCAVQHTDLVEKLGVVLRQDCIDVFNGFVHCSTISRMVCPPTEFIEDTSYGLNAMINNGITMRRVLSTMGVFHNTNLRGKKQWVCSVTVDKVKATSLHATYEEANNKLIKIRDARHRGIFVGNTEKPLLSNIKLGDCVVDETKALGERCTKAMQCSRYEFCLRTAAKLDMKGWKIHDIDRKGNAVG